MKTIIIFLVASLSISFKSFAQIQGDIVDPKEKGISNAIIIAIDSVRNTADTVKTDHRGFYEFKNLRPGKYKIQVKANGFKLTTIENIIVREGDVGAVSGEPDLYSGQRLDITLTPLKKP